MECMPIYGGGLGVLSGDHLKAASDGAAPLVGVGLLYQKGYLQQSLNPDGWQQERNPINDFYTLPVRPVRDEDGKEVMVTVKLPTGLVYIKIWNIDVGRVKLYLLDTNVPENERAGGSRNHRATLWRRQSHAHPAGNRVGHRRSACAGPAQPETHGVAHERGPLRVPGHRAHAPLHQRVQAHFRRSV